MTVQPDAVVFDIGETIRNDTPYFQSWAAWLGVPIHTFSAVLGGLRVAGFDTNEVFRVFRPDSTYSELWAMRRAATLDIAPLVTLYDDAIPTMVELRRRGITVGVAGNQDETTTQHLRSMDMPVDFIETSASCGASKPDPRFFQLLADRCGSPPGRILYVGDHYENDVLPAHALGMQTALVRRGPWAHLRLHLGHDVSNAGRVLDGLEEVLAMVTPSQFRESHPGAG